MATDIEQEMQAKIAAGDVIEEYDVKLPASHYRLCYNRMGEDWRLRDERTGELRFVKGYYGPMNIDWLDHGSHVFHNGPVNVDQNGIAHFVDPDDNGS